MPLKVLKKSHFLNTVYKELDYENGSLYDVNSNKLKAEDYINKGEWLEICKHINRQNSFKIEKIFFVKDNPVILFTNVTDLETDDLSSVYNKIWCIARPRLLYLATPFELNVLDLTHKPFSDTEDLRKNALERVGNTVEILQTLKEYRREQIESGKLFELDKFKSIKHRADLALIDNLKLVRNKLFELGLKGKKLKYAHSLIGRSIFIRYLEDRKILTRDYFSNIAKKNKKWEQILKQKPEKEDLNKEVSNALYIKVLSDRDFTFALYDQLAKDFNGDIFPTDSEERKNIKLPHLAKLQELLRGDNQEQGKLFFETYKFDIIPIETISNIYEEFYHYKSSEEISPYKDNEGTHYTPPTLVEFVLSSVLTKKVIETKPRILDPACGSGIFLVEAFNRIVRYELYKKKKTNLTFNQLKNILKKQISGIELNPEAIKITAFSLYLAFLNFQKPRDILKQIKKNNKLPSLIYVRERNESKTKEYFDILINVNTFDLNVKNFDKNILKRFEEGTFDIVIGNPPWGSIEKQNNPEGAKAIHWCIENNKPISDNEYSQIFTWKTIEFLKPNAFAGLLVSSGMFLKLSNKNKQYKQTLLKTIKLLSVVNFVNLRGVFFKANSPFVFILFQKQNALPDDLVNYWSLKRTRIIEHTHAIVLDYSDYKFIRYANIDNDKIWKIFFIGNKNDLSLINSLQLFTRLKDLIDPNQKRKQGFIEGEKKEVKVDSDWLKNFKEFPTKKFSSRYEKINFSKSLKPVPPKVKQIGYEYNYKGLRILIKDGITEKGSNTGTIISRLEDRDFCFRSSISCVLLKEKSLKKYKIILGILWSSLTKYFFFLTASKWPIWYHNILVDEIMNMPILFPEEKLLEDKIIDSVDSLRNGKFSEGNSSQTNMFNSNKSIKQLEDELDECIFDLYMLTEAERDLVKNRLEIDLDLFYNQSNSFAVKPVVKPLLKCGTANDLIGINKLGTSEINPILNYIKTLLDSLKQFWNREKNIFWDIIYPNHVPMIAVVMSYSRNITTDKTVRLNELDGDINWKNLLIQLDELTQYELMEQVYIQGVVRFVNENQIIIIKRNEVRLWTNTSAREDAEAFFVNAISSQKKQENYAH